MPATLIPSTLTPAGYGVVAPSELGPPSPLLADNLDFSTGDFVSLEEGMDPIESQVCSALRIQRASGPAVKKDGSNFHKIRKMNVSDMELSSTAKEAFSRLIRNKDIEFRGLDKTYWETESQTGEVYIKWRNLRALKTGERSTLIYKQ